MADTLPQIPPRTPLRVALTFIGGMLAFGLFGIGIWLLVESYSNVPTVEEQRARARLDYKHEVETEGRRMLETYGWSDRENNLAHMPVDEAMKRVVADYSESGTEVSEVPVPGSEAAQRAAAALMAGGADGDAEEDAEDAEGADGADAEGAAGEAGGGAGNPAPESAADDVESGVNSDMDNLDGGGVSADGAGGRS